MLMKWIGGEVTKTLKSLAEEFYGKMNLDEDAELDKDEFARWADVIGHAVGDLDDAVDQEKLLAIFVKLGETAKEIQDYITHIKLSQFVEPDKD